MIIREVKFLESRTTFQNEFLTQPICGGDCDQKVAERIILRDDGLLDSSGLRYVSDELGDAGHL